MKLWNELSEQERIDRVTLLISARREVLLERQPKTRTSKRKKRAIENMTFKTKELEELFHTLPPEIQSFIVAK